jgi:superfamily II DNA/RNA helicase
MKFTEFNLNENLLEALDYMGFENATPIQELAMPEILSDRDLIACAQTGTGKTAAFILPILTKLSSQTAAGSTDTLILVPTRELALQIDREIQGFAYFAPAVSIPIYGGGDGSDWGQQKKALTDGADIIVATPGKLISHLNMGYVKFDNLRHLILDEADRMLDIGFHDDILKIISFLPQKRQTLMFSATMPYKIRELASKILHEQVEISLEISKPASGVTQMVYLTHESQKNEIIHRILKEKPEYESVLIFSSTKIKVNDIVRFLQKKSYSVKGISSDLEQDERENVLLDFRARRTRILVATDVLSRGIDIKDINLVINYHVPGDAEDYVHRIGRTARADASGAAITLVSPEEMRKFAGIERLIEQNVPKISVPEDMGESPIWDPNAKKDFKRKSGQRKKSSNDSKKSSHHSKQQKNKNHETKTFVAEKIPNKIRVLTKKQTPE